MKELFSSIFSREKITKLITILKQKDYLKILLLFTFLFVVFSWMYFSSERFLTNDDHFFHIRFAEIFREQGLQAFSNFHWLYFSNISEGSFFVYYNFLFYIFLIPFTFVAPLFLGIKLAGVTLMSGALALLYYAFLKLKIRYPLIWIFVFLSVINEGVAGRLLNARPFVLSPVLLIIFLYLLHKKKYWLSAALCVVYFYWHGATFFFPLLVAIIYFLFYNLYTRKYNWKLILFPLIGTLAAWIATLFFAPGFNNYMGNVLGIYWETILGKKANLNEGNELYPYEALEFIRMQLWLSSLFIFAVVFEIYQYVHLKRQRLSLSDNIFYDAKEQIIKATFFFLSLAFFFGCFAISKRYNDYFIFFGVAYVAMSFGALLKFIVIKNDLFKKALLTSLVVIFLYLVGSNVIAMRSSAQINDPFDKLEESSLWIKENVPSREVIFHPTWNWFTNLFYYNPDNYYLAGLEPRYMYEYNPELYWAWRNISEKGFVCFKERCQDTINQQRIILGGQDEGKKKIWYNQEGKKIANFLVRNLKTHYIVTSSSYFRLNEILNNYSQFEKVFTGKKYSDVFVYKIK